MGSKKFRFRISSVFSWGCSGARSLARASSTLFHIRPQNWQSLAAQNRTNALEDLSARFVMRWFLILKHPVWCRSSQRPIMEGPSELNTKYSKNSKCIKHIIVKYTFLIGNDPELNQRHVYNKQLSCFCVTKFKPAVFSSLGTSAFSHLKLSLKQIKWNIVKINNKIKLLIKYKTAIWLLSSLTPPKKAYLSISKYNNLQFTDLSWMKDEFSICLYALPACHTVTDWS